VAVDDTRHSALISRYDEKLECRELQSGAPLWEHSWSDLLSAAERRRLADASGFSRTAPGESVRIHCFSFLVAPDAIYLALISGDVLKLSPEGKRLWRDHAEAPVAALTGFENGVLAVELYFPPQSLMPDLSYMPFMTVPPRWKSIRSASEKDITQGAFESCAVLDPGSGKQLDLIELEHYAQAGPVPAYDMIVFGDGGAGGTPRVFAYPWLERGAN
jgi:hypothetical protein